MIAALKQFFYMGGYGLYVWGSYGSVIIFLFLQWFRPWRRWHHYSRQQNKQSICQTMSHQHE